MTQGILFDDGLERSAVLSPCNNYRYVLKRVWRPSGKTIAFVCLNPSTADGQVDDPTVRKCIRFAKKWDGGTLVIANLFAFRSVDPRLLRQVVDPVGPDNDAWLEHVASTADVLVAAWGCHGTLGRRDETVAERFHGRLHALRLTKDGHPSHPLYLPEHLVPELIR